MTCVATYVTCVATYVTCDCTNLFLTTAAQFIVLNDKLQCLRIQLQELLRACNVPKVVQNISEEYSVLDLSKGSGDCKASSSLGWALRGGGGGGSRGSAPQTSMSTV